MVNIDWKPDKGEDTPLYLQIVRYIKSKISKGEWPVGSPIPPQRALAEMLGVNRSTVVAAVDELVAEGLLEGHGRSGTRVVNNTWSLLASTPPPDWYAYIKSGIHQPNHYTIQQINRSEFIPGIIRLGTGEMSPELFPKETMAKLMGNMAGRMRSLGYEEPKGSLGLREQISQRLRGLGINVSASAILVVSGALQALQLIAMGLLHRGSEILVESPSYLYSLHVFQSAGMQLSGVPMDEKGIRSDMISLLKRQRKAALLYTIPTFHNPTGVLMPEERRKQLLETCEREQMPVIEDDAYRELWLDAVPPKPLKAMDKAGLVLYLGSLSKSLSPGFRIGWVAGPEPVIERLADIKMQTDYGSSSLSQWAAEEWLGSGLYDAHLEYIRGQLAIRRNTALNALNKHFKCIAQWNIPSGGFYIWLRLLPGISMQALFNRALGEGILLNPGSVYDHCAGSCLRLSYAYAGLEELEKGIAKLARIIKELN